MKKTILAIFVTMLVCTLGLCAFMGGKLGSAAANGSFEKGGSANGAHAVPSVPVGVVPIA